MSYLKDTSTPRKTPQSEAIPGSTQTENEAGGFAWEVSPMRKLRRWLILGSEGGTYYASQRKLTAQNTKALREALDEHGVDAVTEIINVSVQGRAPKQDQAIYALAVAAAHKNEDVRGAALSAVSRVCRTGTHLFMFCDFVQGQRGWGPALRKAIAAWYQREDVDSLAYQLVKYRQREGWTHRDVLRKCHAVPPTEFHNELYHWVTQGTYRVDGENEWAAGKVWTGPAPLRAHLEAMKADKPADTVKLLGEHGNRLPREAVNPEHLGSPEVWEALLDQGMPMTALLRNLATLTRVGIAKPMSEGAKKVVTQLEDKERFRKARVHPLAILMALYTYKQGHGLRGTGKWIPVPQIIDALDEAFYAAFDYVEPTGKRRLVALDVSGSMTWGMIAGAPLHPREAAAAMAMTTVRSEPECAVVAFTSQHGTYGARGSWGITPLPISAKQRLDDVIKVMEEQYPGGTDCALPMIFAEEEKLEVDTFEVYTDNETWAGNIHPSQALKRYREKSGIGDSKLAVVALTAGRDSIADPNDPNMLDFEGFDTSTPAVLSQFVKGEL